MLSFILNRTTITTDKPNGSLLLDFIRYERSLTGTKIGCREGDCGACTVLVGDWVSGRMKYEQLTSCLTPIGNVRGKHVVTIEGLNLPQLSPAQRFMVEESGTQCGFCTVGFVVSMAAFCLAHDSPTYPAAIAAIDGNICRCTGYKSIERAARHLTKALVNKNTDATIDWLVEHAFIPAYFKEIPQRLKSLPSPPTPPDNGLLVGGGTDLYVQRPEELIQRQVAVIADEAAYRFTQTQNGTFKLGGANTVTDLAESAALQALFPRLQEWIKLVSSSPIRNISTLAGNFVNASPIGDFTILFLALNAQISLRNQDQQRWLYLKDFYLGYKELDKTPEERIFEISFPTPDAHTHLNFEKVSKRTHLDIASVNSAAQVSVADGHITQAHISAGGVSPIPLYLEQTSRYLENKALSPDTVRHAQSILQTEISPISDVRGSADYKRLLLRQLFFAHFIELFPEQISLKALT